MIKRAFGKRISACLMVVLALLTGCHTREAERITITQPIYEKKVYETAEVCQGTLTPAISLNLHRQKLKYLYYSVKDSGLEVEKVAVSVGDKVEKGDLLISFSSEEFQNTLEEYQEQDQQDKFLIQHYRNLQKADPSQNYKEEIRELKRERTVLQLYIKETEKKIRRNQLYAKHDGTITGVSSGLKDGSFLAGSTLVTEAYGSGNYVAETDHKESFTEGVTVQAESDALTFQMKLTRVESVNANSQKLHFKPLSDMSAVAEDASLVVKWKKTPIRDCIYVDQRAIHSLNGREFVYRVDENGYYEVVEVETGNTVGDDVIITKGLSVGEKVRVA